MATLPATLECPATDAEPLAKGLGWFSIGLGVAEVVAPGPLARMIGVPRNHTLIRALGLREIAAGAGILTREKPAYWIWARVAGDVIDLALLGSAFTSRRSHPARVAGAAAAVAGVAVLDVLAGRQHSSKGALDRSQTLRVARSITVGNSPDECYRWWRDFSNLPRVLRHVESVEVTGASRARWVVRAPGDRRLLWETEMTTDEPGAAIAWHSLEDSSVENSGSVHFEAAPAGRGTIVRVAFHYCPPGGHLYGLLAKALGDAPELELAKDLRRFKQLLETGEIATTEGQPSGRAAGKTLLDRIAS